MGRRDLIWPTVLEPSDLAEWSHTEASLDEYLLGGERGLHCEILLALNSVIGAESSGSHKGGVEWGEEELSRLHSGEWGQIKAREAKLGLDTYACIFLAVFSNDRYLLAVRSSHTRSVPASPFFSRC